MLGTNAERWEEFWTVRAPRRRNGASGAETMRIDQRHLGRSPGSPMPLQAAFGIDLRAIDRYPIHTRDGTDEDD